jgi:Brp/Blh family beta-carotene 15,15'-monooxygenase
MKNYIGALMTFVYLIAYWFIGPWEKTIDLYVAGLLLVLTGIPHGAGDHLIAKKIAARHQRSFHLTPFIAYYVGIMVVYALFWYWLPTLAFVIFIGISVFHFGDMEDLEKIPPKGKFLSMVRTLFLGSGILTFILFSHWSEVVEIIKQMKVSVPQKTPNSFIYVSLSLLILGFQKKNFHHFFNTLLTLLAGYFLPLIPAFIFYFSCCHAVYSITGLIEHLDMKIATLYKKLLPFSAGAMFLGIIYITLISKDLQLYPIFIFLSLLTLPHFILMHQLIKH